MTASAQQQTGLWLPIVLLQRATARFRGDQQVRVVVTSDPASRTDDDAMRAHVVCGDRVVAHVVDEELGAALVAVLESAPECVAALGETLVEVLRLHNDSAAHPGTCGSCGHPVPCPTRTLLQERVGAGTTVGASSPASVRKA